MVGKGRSRYPDWSDVLVYHTIRKEGLLDRWWMEVHFSSSVNGFVSNMAETTSVLDCSGYRNCQVGPRQTASRKGGMMSLQ